MVMNEHTGTEEEVETTEHYEWRMKRTFADRNIVYNVDNDRYDRYTEVGYIHDIRLQMWFRCRFAESVYKLPTRYVLIRNGLLAQLGKLINMKIYLERQQALYSRIS
jgi:hypothetical protein